MGIKPILAHITHEAAAKMGGIGAVLEGFFTCQSYLDAVDRSIIIGPLFTTDGSVLDRLGDDGEVLYSSIDGLVNTGYASAFSKIETFYGVGIIYGRRTFVDSQTGIKSSPEVVLLDVRHADIGLINEFKGKLFEEFEIRSDLYEHLWEFEQYVRLAPAALAVLKAIGAATDKTVIVAHEYMGMPTALAAILDQTCNYKTVFYAHEVAPMRKIVEDHPGHDTMFYNVIKKAHQQKLYVNDIFGNQDLYFKYPLVDASKHCDAILAVGGLVADELRFLAPEFESGNISVVYNGIHAYKTTVEEKLASKHKLQQYCFNLLGFTPISSSRTLHDSSEARDSGETSASSNTSMRPSQGPAKPPLCSCSPPRSLSGEAAISSKWKHAITGPSRTARAGPTSQAARRPSIPPSRNSTRKPKASKSSSSTSSASIENSAA